MRGIISDDEGMAGMPCCTSRAPLKEEADNDLCLKFDFFIGVVIFVDIGAEGLRMLPVFGFGNDGSILLVFNGAALKRASSASVGVGVTSASSSPYPSLGVTGSGIERDDVVEEEGVRVAYSSAPYANRDIDGFPATSETEEYIDASELERTIRLPFPLLEVFGVRSPDL